jgi:hypothetical protein
MWANARSTPGVAFQDSNQSRTIRRRIRQLRLSQERPFEINILTDSNAPQLNRRIDGFEADTGISTPGTNDSACAAGLQTKLQSSLKRDLVHSWLISVTTMVIASGCSLIRFDSAAFYILSSAITSFIALHSLRQNCDSFTR